MVISPPQDSTLQTGDQTFSLKTKVHILIQKLITLYFTTNERPFDHCKCGLVILLL